jgi:hypothetical protein
VIDIAADLPLNAVKVEITDPSGAGFLTWIGPTQMVDVALRLNAAVLRLMRATP